jgi:hypothetical protein
MQSVEVQVSLPISGSLLGVQFAEVEFSHQSSGNFLRVQSAEEQLSRPISGSLLRVQSSPRPQIHAVYLEWSPVRRANLTCTASVYLLPNHCRNCIGWSTYGKS